MSLGVGVWSPISVTVKLGIRDGRNGQKVKQLEVVWRATIYGVGFNSLTGM